MTKIIAITFFILITFLIGTTPVFAQDIGLTNSLGTIANQAGVKTDVGTDTFLNTTVGGLIAMVLGLVGAIFLALTIFSGFQWMTAGGNEEKVTQSRKRLVNATIGLGVVILAYVITNAVFGLFYQVSNRPTTGLNSPAGIPCENSNQCPGNYVCENGQCVLLCLRDSDCPPGQQCSITNGHCEIGWGQNTCENNSECPPEAPICYEFLFWQTCTCTSNDDCPTATPHCVSTSNYQSPPDLNSGFPAECVPCLTYQDCNQPGGNPPGGPGVGYQDCQLGQCEAVDCIEELNSDCSDPETPTCQDTLCVGSCYDFTSHATCQDHEYHYCIWGGGGGCQVNVLEVWDCSRLLLGDCKDYSPDGAACMLQGNQCVPLN